MNGQNERFNNIQIDGSVNNDLFALGSSTGIPGGAVNERPISIEAVQEFQIQIAPFDVRQGGFVGGLVNAVTKSGTNELHGSLFGYMQNQSFVGSDTSGVSVPVPTYQQQQFGFSLGGPIVRDKLHFFVTGDFRHDVRPFASGLQIGNSGAASDTLGIGITSAQADSVSKILDSLGYKGAGQLAGAYHPEPRDQPVREAGLRARRQQPPRGLGHLRQREPGDPDPEVHVSLQRP